MANMTKNVATRAESFRLLNHFQSLADDSGHIVYGFPFLQREANQILRRQVSPSTVRGVLKDGEFTYKGSHGAPDGGALDELTARVERLETLLEKLRSDLYGKDVL